jgi:hypothetical protein
MHVERLSSFAGSISDTRTLTGQLSVTTSSWQAVERAQRALRDSAVSRMIVGVRVGHPLMVATARKLLLTYVRVLRFSALGQASFYIRLRSFRCLSFCRLCCVGACAGCKVRVRVRVLANMRIGHTS